MKYLILLALVSGCTWQDVRENLCRLKINEFCPKEPTPPSNPGTPTPPPIADDFPEGITFLHTNVGNWPVTATLESVTVSGNSIHMPYSHARIWATGYLGQTAVNANPWVIAQREGKWYAATWEWLRPGQTTKAASAVEGGHIKRSQFNGWRPRSGERLGFFISGLARAHQRNAQERTNIVWITWP